MRFVFRTDASTQIGTGHVMRCLTLADALKSRGAQCHFICREHPGNLIELIKNKEHTVTALPLTLSSRSSPGADVPHAHWLGVSPQEDAAQTLVAMGHTTTDWLIVDHYALDACWERELKPCYHKLMVIDDLADRQHRCDLLLDQTLGRRMAEYTHWVPKDCTILCGTDYALLRPEFALWRPYSLKRRQIPQLGNILVTMGGVDKDNVTGRVLDVLGQIPLPAKCKITVVMGTMAPGLNSVRQQAATLAHPTTVLTGVSNMARLMADSDLAIGAGGATSWERCCLGLPTIMMVLAENQRQVASSLELAGAATTVASVNLLGAQLPKILLTLAQSKEQLTAMSTAAAQVTNGQGVHAVIEHLRL